MALVFGVCVKYLGEKHLAQDATMEVFEKMLGYQPRSSVSNFRAYLFVIAKNHCLMKQRGEKVISINFSFFLVELIIFFAEIVIISPLPINLILLSMI